MKAEEIFEILNFTNAYVIVLDFAMTIRFVNISLYTKLGFKTHKELINRCWLDFIPLESHDKIKTVHSTMLSTIKNDYHEFCNDIIDVSGNVFKVKWINTAINHTTNWTFSFGIPMSVTVGDVTEDEIRHQFKTIIDSDRIMIKNLKEYVKSIPKSFNLIRTCDPEF